MTTAPLRCNMSTMKFGSLSQFFAQTEATFIPDVSHDNSERKVIIRVVEKEVVQEDEVKEEEANNFAADFLIPRKEYNRLKKLDHYSKALISRFAENLHISPGIIVGRLQHDKLLPMSHCNDLKRRFEWINE